MSDLPKSFGELSYETFADRYAAVIPTKPHNAYLADPAIKALLPDLNGLRILDAGCGPGTKSQEMLDAGAASVTAIDVTPRFVEMTRDLIGSRATVLRHDLRQPLDFAAEGAFDLIHSNLVLGYIEDWYPIMREFFRVLSPGGWLLFSEGDPVGDWNMMQHPRIDMDETPNYFKVQAFAFAWAGFGEPKPVVWGYRRSIEDSLNPVMDAGFILDRIVETRPVAKYHEVDPEDAARYDRQPTFMCVRARKPGA